MKRYLIVGALFLMASCAGQNGGKAAANVEPQSVVKTEAVGRSFDLTPGDKLIPTKLGEIDLGRMRAGEVLRCDFSLVNKCGKPIVILEVKGSCGCVGLDTDLKPFADGQSKTVKMSYDSKGKEGRQLAIVTIKTSAGDYKIELKGDVRND